MKTSQFNPDISVGRSWEDFLQWAEHCSGWIFRGHASENWALQTTIERSMPDGASRASHESQFYSEFKRRAHNYIPAQELPESDGQWLALMQHYGAPTRLLDFTYSPYVAAYFAFEESPGDGCDKVAVVAVNPIWCYEQIGRLLLGGRAFFGASEHFWRKQMAGAREKGADADSDALLAGIIVTARVEGNALSQQQPFVATLSPSKLSQRMSVQQGVFLWPASPGRSFAENIGALDDHHSGVRVLTLPAGQRGRALEQLRWMNITRTSLFPGLEGFAQSFRQSAIREPLEQRAIRLALMTPWLPQQAMDLNQEAFLRAIKGGGEHE